MNKQELLDLAKELASLEDLKDRRGDLERLKREYQRLSKREDESLSDEKLNEALSEYYAILAKKDATLSASVADDKKALIEKAKALVTRSDVLPAYREFLAIMEDWKKVGHSSNKEEDDALWEQMREIRRQVNANKDAYFEELGKKNAEKHAQKEAIIAQAKEALALESIKEASAKMDALMEEWRKVGFSGKADDALWKEFSEVRKEFSHKRKAHFESMMKTYQERVAKKEELIKEVRMFVGNSNFDKSEIDQIKAFRAKWKEIGFAGKDKDETLYQEFNGLLDQYFEDRRAYTNK